jgi:hypothetical protein
VYAAYGYYDGDVDAVYFFGRDLNSADCRSFTLDMKTFQATPPKSCNIYANNAMKSQGSLWVAQGQNFITEFELPSLNQLNTYPLDNTDGARNYVPILVPSRVRGQAYIQRMYQLSRMVRKLELKPGSGFTVTGNVSMPRLCDKPIDVGPCPSVFNCLNPFCMYSVYPYLPGFSGNQSQMVFLINTTSMTIVNNCTFSVNVDAIDDIYFTKGSFYVIRGRSLYQVSLPDMSLVDMVDVPRLDECIASWWGTFLCLGSWDYTNGRRTLTEVLV